MKGGRTASQALTSEHIVWFLPNVYLRFELFLKAEKRFTHSLAIQYTGYTQLYTATAELFLVAARALASNELLSGVPAEAPHI